MIRYLRLAGAYTLTTARLAAYSLESLAIWFSIHISDFSRSWVEAKVEYGAATETFHATKEKQA